MTTIAATTPIFVCPQCRTPVRAGDTTCRACGTNLALAAALAERYTLAGLESLAAAAPDHSRSAPRAHELPRFGEYLVSQGYITPAQLSAGLTRQREAAALGGRRTIGQTLLALGVITAEQLELAGIQQVKQLQNQLEDNNRQLEQRV